MKMRISPWISVLFKYTHRSFQEFKYIIIFGLLPLWGVYLLLFLMGKDANKYALGYLINGEALLICAATIGPLLFQLVDGQELRRSRIFPMRVLYFIVVVLVCIIASLILGVKHLTGLQESLSQVRMIAASTIVTALSILIWFLVIGTNAALAEGAPSIMRRDEQNFVDDYGKAD